MSRARTASGSQSALREANSERLLQAVRRFGAITQVELAEATGLSPATVSTIVKDLLAAGAVETRQTVRSGRRAQLVTLAHQSGLLVGIHIGERIMRIAIADTALDVVEEQTMPLPADHRADTTLDRAALLITELVETLGATLPEVLAVGLGMAGPIDPATGMLAGEGIVRGWEGVPLGAVLERRLARPVVVDNDANLGALAELRHGAGRGLQDLLYVRASFGVGGGVVLGGDLHRGRHGIAGEVGHTLIDPQGPICRCGSRGCLNTVVGAQALIDALRLSRGNLSLGDLLELAVAGDPGASQVIIDAGAAIGTAVANLAVAFNPEAVVVGGELSRTGDLLLDPIRAAVSRRVLLTQHGPLPVLASALGDLAEIKGALVLAADHAHVTAVRP